MFELARTIRFCISFADNDLRATSGEDRNAPSVPEMRNGLAAYYELVVRCRGEADPTTGYLLNISAIDDAVRKHAVSFINRCARQVPHRQSPQVLRDVAARLQPRLNHSISSVTWRLTPEYSLTLETKHMDHVQVNQLFDFAAAHRLHCPELSDEENRRIFGKCNNPNGHGHNYRLEVAVSVPLPGVAEEEAEQRQGLPEFQSIVDKQVIQRFDHTHLNLDTAEFAQLNPSVENIARVCHDLLAAPIASAGGQLLRVTVWETEKTSCTYPIEMADR